MTSHTFSAGFTPQTPSSNNSCCFHIVDRGCLGRVIILSGVEMVFSISPKYMMCPKSPLLGLFNILHTKQLQHKMFTEKLSFRSIGIMKPEGTPGSSVTAIGVGLFVAFGGILFG